MTTLAWALIGATVSASLARWHLRRTVPRLPEPDPDVVGEAVVAAKPPYSGLDTPRRRVGVTVVACLLGAASVLAPAWTRGLWWVWAGSVTTLVAVDAATTFLPLRLWRRCLLEAIALAVATAVVSRDPSPGLLTACGLAAVSAWLLLDLVWRFGGGIGYGDVRLAAGTGLLGACCASEPAGVATAVATTLLATTVAGALAALVTASVRRRRPSAWGQAFAYGPALWVGPWATLAATLVTG